MTFTFKALLAAVVTLAFSSNALAASASGTARQVVTAAISIVNVSDLDFGTAIQGAVAKVVAPGAAENAENGSFTVSGQASTAYTVTLPASVTMTTGGGGANETILVNTFTSFPAAGANGMIGVGGTQLLLVGATRDALGAAQVVGTYTGSYTVDVVY
jgi:hypothetical protein